MSDVEGAKWIAPRWLTVDQAAMYTGYAKGTLYHMVSERRIPFVKKRRSLRFDRQRLDDWMEKDIVRSVDDY